MTYGHGYGHILPPNPTDAQVYLRAIYLFGADGTTSHDAAVRTELLAEGATSTQTDTAIQQYHFAFDDAGNPR